MMRDKLIFFLLGFIIVVAMILLFLQKGDNDPVAQSMPATEMQMAIVAETSHQDTVSVSEESPSIFTQQTESASLNTSVVPHDESMQSRSNSVKVAGQEFPLLFESPNISDVLKDMIVHDVELNLSHFEHITLRDVSDEPVDPGQVSSLTATHLLDEGRPERLFPEVFERYFGGVIVSNGVPRIIVRDELIKEYEGALDYKEQHPVMFDRLDEFLSRLRDSGFAEKVAQDEALARSVNFFNYPPSREYAHETSVFLKSVTIRNPSILDFYPAENYGAKEGVVCMPLIIWPKGMSLEPVMKGAPLFIYIDEEWHLYVPRLP